MYMLLLCLRPDFGITVKLGVGGRGGEALVNRLFPHTRYEIILRVSLPVLLCVSVFGSVCVYVQVRI